jgi:hypothetical protein
MPSSNGHLTPPVTISSNVWGGEGRIIRSSSVPELNARGKEDPVRTWTSPPNLGGISFNCGAVWEMEKYGWEKGRHGWGGSKSGKGGNGGGQW